MARTQGKVIRATMQRTRERVWADGKGQERDKRTGRFDSNLGQFIHRRQETKEEGKQVADVLFRQATEHHRHHELPTKIVHPRKVHLYVLRLLCGKWYVGAAFCPSGEDERLCMQKLNNRFECHWEGSRGALWTRLFPPVQVEQIYFYAPETYELWMTFTLMQRFGVNSVRGASWLRAQLSAKHLETISRLWQDCPIAKRDTSVHTEIKVTDRIMKPLEILGEEELRRWVVAHRSAQGGLLGDIYILKLEQYKWFVGFTHDMAVLDINRHVLGTHPDGSFTRMFRPVRIVDVFRDVNKDHATAVTLHFMHKYSIDDVRGAHWTHPNLSPQQRAKIENAMSTRSQLKAYGSSSR